MKIRTECFEDLPAFAGVFLTLCHAQATEYTSLALMSVPSWICGPSVRSATEKQAKCLSRQVYQVLRINQMLI